MEEIKVGSIVEYIGVHTPQLGLVKGGTYEVDRVTEFGALGIKGIKLVNGQPFTFNANQFKLAESTKIREDLNSPLEVKGEAYENVFEIEEIELTLPSGKVLTTFSELVFGNDSEESESEKYTGKIQREMKFKNSPGSAVVHYANGNIFHITRLVLMEVGLIDGVEKVVALERKYEKDGILFSQTAHVPTEMFVKVVYKPLEHGILDDEVTITYNEEKNVLVWATTQTATRLELM